MAENRFSKFFEDADALFTGHYNIEIEALRGISNEEVKEISGEIDGMRTYSVLMKVVEQASRDNLTQAQLGEHIKELGSLAINIARKVPELASIID